MPEVLRDDEGPPIPDTSHLITEDERPVDSLYSERQQQLLSAVLFDSWEEGKPFEAMGDVGLFSKASNEDVVSPDFLLSLGVEPAPESNGEKVKSYFTWVYGKPPSLVVEIVSNKKGGELDRKFSIYERVGVAYYAVYDPFCLLGQRVLRLFQRTGGRYVELADPTKMPELGLNFILWDGTFYEVQDRWLRFTDAQGELLLTGQEKVEQTEAELEAAESRATEAEQKAQAAEQKAQEALERAAQLEAELRQLRDS